MPVLAESTLSQLGNDLWLVVPAFFFAVLAATVIGRVLGVRRTFASTVASALAGWLLGVVLAIWVASRSEPATAQYARNLFLFTLLGTMAAAVWIEFLSRPGMMARAQTSLRSLPHPVRSMERRTRRMRRYAEITRIALREGLGPSLGLGRHHDTTARPPVRRLRRALEEGGGMFVKLGQVLSTRSDLISPEAAKELSSLQDHVPPADSDAVRAELEADLGVAVDTIFEAFDWEPVAAASLGQVHKAQLSDGAAVVVKVQRPGIDDAVEVDLSVLDELGHMVENRTSWGREYHVLDVIAEFSTRLREELDYRIEARNATLVAATLPTDSVIRVPSVYPELSTSRVLVMEWVDGTSVRDVDWGDRDKASRVKLADTLLQTFLHQMLEEGVYHADPHPGNVMLTHDGALALIDFGATGRLDGSERTALRDLLAGITTRDADAVAQAILQVGRLRRGVDMADFERALSRFIARHLAAGSRPDAAMFNAMLRLMFEFGITMPPEWSTFFRALIVLEGTLTEIAPGYSVIDAAESIAGQWTRSRITPSSVQQALRDELVRTVPMLRRLPRHVDRAFTMLERGGLPVRITTFSDPHDEHVVSRLVNRFVLSFLAGAIGLLSVGLLAIQGGPPFVGSTTLFRVFGYFGLFCATVLAMRVIVAVLRDGLN
jgi:ubiquinone biosynthesis protein